MLKLKKSFWDIFLGEKPLTYCRICNRPVFNLKTKFAEKGLCVYCYDAYQEGYNDRKN